MTMKAYHLICPILSFACFATAQDLSSLDEDAPTEKEIQGAIDAFNQAKKKDREGENEVTVVIPPTTEKVIAPKAIIVTEPLEDKKIEKSIASKADETKKKKAVLVSGRPPENSKNVTKSSESEDNKLEPELVKEEPKGLEIRVESIRSGSGKIDPEKIRLKTSFPVKALGEAPQGWMINSSGEAPPFTREVEIESGVFVSLAITPHLLSPSSDGKNHFSIAEPGFNPQHGYQQIETVGSILGDSITKLDQDALRMGNALSDLHRLLASLPKPTETPEKQ